MLYSLLHKLRKDLRGVCFSGCDVPSKLSVYTDDIIALDNTQKDINVCSVNTVNEFGYISSAKPNWKKSEAVGWGINSGYLQVWSEWKQGLNIWECF